MNILKATYSITIYENGKFCWKAIKRDKTKEEMKSDLKWLLVYTAFYMGFFVGSYVS